MFVQHGNRRGAGKTESEQPTAGVEREGFRPINTNQRGKSTQLAGDVRSLTLKIGGIGLGGVRVTENMRSMQADAGAEAALRGQQLNHTRSRELFLGPKQGAEQQLVGLCVERGETEKRMFHRRHLARRCGRRRLSRYGPRFHHRLGLCRRFGEERHTRSLRAEQAAWG